MRKSTLSISIFLTKSLYQLHVLRSDIYPIPTRNKTRKMNNRKKIDKYSKCNKIIRVAT